MKLFEMKNRCWKFVVDRWVNETPTLIKDKWVFYHKVKEDYIDSFILDGNDFNHLGVFAYDSFREWYESHGYDLNDFPELFWDNVVANYVWDMKNEDILDYLGLI